MIENAATKDISRANPALARAGIASDTTPPFIAPEGAAAVPRAKGTHGHPDRKLVPQTLSEEAFDALRDLHEMVASDFQVGLASLLKHDASVNLAQLELGSYSHFVFGRPIPTCFVLLSVAPLQSTFAIHVCPQILYTILDRMLGSPEPVQPSPRPLTEIETRLASRVIRLFLDKYQQNWEHVLSLQVNVQRFVHNPLQLRVMPGSEPTLMASFETRVGKSLGFFELCVPLQAMQRMADRLSARRQSSGPTADSEIEPTVLLSVQLPDLPWTGPVGQPLQVGDVIRTDRTSDSLFDILVNGQPRFQGTLGTHHGRKAIQIQ